MDALREHKLMRLLSDDPSCILVLKDGYVTDNLWKICIQQEPALFQYMKNPSIDMCLYALQEDGSNLKYIVENKNIKITPKMCYTAVKSYPPAIFDVPVEMRDHNIKEFAFDLDPTLIRHFTNVRKVYIDRKLKEDPTFIRFLDDPDEDLIYRAIEADPNYCVYVKHFTPRLKALVETLYPDIIPLLPNIRK